MECVLKFENPREFVDKNLEASVRKKCPHTGAIFNWA